MKSKEPAGSEALKFKLSDLLTSRNFVRMCVVAGCFALLLIVFPRMGAGPTRAPRIHCVSTLHQTSIGLHLYANDNGGRYPRSTVLVGNGYVWTNFAVAGKYIASPKVLLCPADTSRLKNAKGRFPSHQENNLSYFYGLSADLSEPNTILAGDRNLTANQASHPGGPDVSPMWSYAGRGPIAGNPGIPLSFGSTPPTCGWNSAMHKFNGNVLLGDCSVQQVTTSLLIAQLNASEDTNNFCLFPIKAPGEK